MEPNKQYKISYTMKKEDIMTFVSGLHNVQMDMIETVVARKEKEGFPEATAVIKHIMDKKQQEYDPIYVILDYYRKTTMKNSPFRIWLQLIYMDHKDEATSLGLPTCDADTYFRMYKYWLKREYQHRQRTENE